ncbi:SDR family NAD(P)-dependent oxidoreductase [Pararobbsia silviterrae]|uniref:SDR family NAD(P)-dependent oxidoreductase n=1 Tax=Pararobbsia silviterrae TaxID=1792498 RepID=A0A494XHJ9_9BURK|nr:SDR family NAD(P)-dependent oxidoreductase [Pararobbsia silviterrae]RKP50227.1 SDR family NAD(P)-dependent oxidoreductase [Pararobbsia silviterrae]
MNVLITGASAGFGRAIAERLVHDGHTVFATARRKDKLDELSRQLGAKLVAFELDVRSREATAALVREIENGHGPIDALVNNAGLALGLGPAQTSSLDEWDTMIDTNIKGLVYMTHAALPAMVERDRGWVINLGSVAGTYPYPGGNVYGATKAFVHQFTLNLKADLVGKHVRVTSIEPGLCGGTEFSVTRFGGDEQKAATVYQGTQPITAADIAETVSWILSLPSHVNINTIEMMPTCQAPNAFAIARSST